MVYSPTPLCSVVFKCLQSTRIRITFCNFPHLLHKLFLIKLLRMRFDFVCIVLRCIESDQMIREFLPRLFIEKLSAQSLDNRLDRAALAIRNHGSSARHRLDRCDSKVFFLRMNKRFCVCVEFALFFFGNTTEKFDIRLRTLTKFFLDRARSRKNFVSVRSRISNFSVVFPKKNNANSTQTQKRLFIRKKKTLESHLSRRWRAELP